MTSLEVFWDHDGTPVPVGQAHVTRTRGRISTTFIYDPGYLAGGGASIDPALPLVGGAQHQQGLIRAFADSAPDRWGRNLLEKAERLHAREEERAPRRLDDVDFLLGVSDDTRQGALRFRVSDGATTGELTGPPSQVPQLISLPELLHAADELDRDQGSAYAVKQLLDTGTTGLGGARPKASVLLDDDSLALAKFPHTSDRWDVMAWEMTALDLLESAGIEVPSRRLVRVGERSVLVLRRFDRTESGGRVGYISAMTALGADDGDHRDYADIAAAMLDLSRSPKADHHALFDRVVASIALGNTDDHLRNHGFLADQGFWRLSPAFDVNPTPDPWRQRSTTILGADAPPDEAEALLPFADECSLGPESARARMLRIGTAISGWRAAAQRNGVPDSELTLFAEAIDTRLAALRAVAEG